jgi:N-acetylneuraminate lyase
MIAVILKHGVLRTGKATMTMIGIDCGPTRAPLLPLVGDELDSVRRAYERMGFFDWSADTRTGAAAVSVSVAPAISSMPAAPSV